MRASSPASAMRTAWLERWGDIVPLLLAEFIVWLGFGALLPVLPIYFTEQGVDLGVARPRHRCLAGGAAGRRAGLRLAGGPDRTGPPDGHRAGRDRCLQHPAAGLHRAAGFRPAARRGRAGDGGLRPGRSRLPDRCDAAGAPRRGVRPVRRGQMGGLLLGPAIGALGAAVSAGSRCLRVRGVRRVPGGRSRSGCAVRETDSADRIRPLARRRPSSRRRRHRRPGGPRTPIDADRGARGRCLAGPEPLWNRGLIAALVINAGGYFAGGTYEVIWSLFLQQLGASLDLDRADLRDVRAAGPAVSPFAGRRGRPAWCARIHRHRVDPAGRHGPRSTRGSPTRSSRSR